MHVEMSARSDNAHIALPTPACRSCAAVLPQPVIDLGMHPLSNAYLASEDLAGMEPFFPLRVRLCAACALVQVDAVIARERIFDDQYRYSSSYSQGWLEHARTYAERIIRDRHLNGESLVVEVASNDGYLLRWFVERGIPVHGIDPARDCAEAAKKFGIDTTVDFFGMESAQKLAARIGRADLLVGNNVLAHVPDLNDFVGGVATMLAPSGLATFEFPHVLELVRQRAFDTIYHEHYSYFSLTALVPLFTRHGLIISHCEQLGTHGGSLRIFVQHHGQTGPDTDVADLLRHEADMGLADAKVYEQLADTIDDIRSSLLHALIDVKRRGLKAAAYGAAAKGNTLLNTMNISPRLLSFVVDKNPQKIGRFLPGSHLPIVAPDAIAQERPDWILVLPWNWADEIVEQLAYTKEWGAEVYRAIPHLEKISGKR